MMDNMGNVVKMWWRSLAWLCLVVGAVSIGWFAYGAAEGLACGGALLLVRFVFDQVQLSRMFGWVESQHHQPPRLGLGAWEDMAARLYRDYRQARREHSALIDALGRFRRAAQALPDGVVMLSASNQILWCNAQAEEHLSLDLSKDSGQNIVNLVRHPNFLAYLSSGRWDQPLVLRMRNGSHAGDRICSIQLVEYGESEKLLLSRDVTKIERLETMRRDFVANVSHELKTPLTVLAGFLETIREVKLPPKQQEHYLGLMAEQAQRMQQLVADLLTLSSLEADQASSEEPIAMAPLIEKIEQSARALSGTRHTLEFSVAPNLNLVGAEGEIASALTNLVTNAIRYTPEGGSIRVRWSLVEEAGAPVAQFAVEDTGIGVPAQHIPRLTERFYRVDRGRSRESGGTGLGLAIVKHVLTRHQGHLDITSTVGKGSLFCAVFPERRIHTGALDRTPQPAHPGPEHDEALTQDAT